MSPRPQQHLAQVAETHGTGAGTATIVKLVEDGLEAERAAQQEQRKKDGKELKKNPYVTDAGKCPRKTYFSLINEPETEPLTTDSLVNFGVGHAIEEWIARLFEVQGAQVIREQRVEIPVGEYVVSGRADFLVALPKERYLIELKSTSSRAMSFMLRSEEAGKEDHRKQLNLYLHASQLGLLGVRPFIVTEPDGSQKVEIEERGRHPHKPYDKGYLVYCVKDATRGEPTIHAFEVPYDKQGALVDLENLRHIAEAAAQGADPGIPIEYQQHYNTKKKPPNFPCGYCGYKSRCWRNQ